MTDGSVILFDGICNLCNGFVDFVIRRDREARFKFGSLQSAEAKALLAGQRAEGESESILFLHKGKIYKRSGAVLRVLRGLCFPWPILSVFLIIPPFIRDAVYTWVARNRYRWFGKRSTCRVPSVNERVRFI